ncbi:ASPIC/UnbV protein [Saccharothrix carnea]|uniref:ASPIC/UnbV protein n=1 Tax=Saccharothrix carnea TaxID=1280637 RepID=A0A2P8HD13_SACCR|nr:CRTAC1 family protein [Saccharothrix carnea]PSL44130.1 ASPIC/UnbV protein [Saccharothrix carnea]
MGATVTAAARKTLSVIAVVAVCAAAGLMVVRPSLGDETSVAARFAFTALNLNETPVGARTERAVAPELHDIRAWISSVGAAVALADVRGTGRAADVCLVDPRDDSVTLRPVPVGGGATYAPFELRPDGLRYDSTMAPMGCVPADLDEDGDVDFVVHYWGRSPVLFVNTGGVGAPTRFRADELIEPMAVWNSGTLNVGDIDGDGHLDLLVGNYFPDGARILDPTASDETRIQMQDSMSLGRNGGTNRILLTRPTGAADRRPAIVDASVALTGDAAQSWTLATGLQDLTGDGLPEVYQANDFGPDQLMVNHSVPGAVRLREVTGARDLVTPKSEVLGRDSFKGMGVAFTYPGGAGLPMMVVSNITVPYGLHESNFAFVPVGSPDDLMAGKVPFTERSEALGLARAGWCWDVKAGDFDNDGVDELVQANGFLKGEVNRWPVLQELAIANDELLRHPAAWPRFGPGDDLSGHEPNRFWVRDGDGRYFDLADRVGAAFPDNTRGLAVGDVDGDGLLDVLVANQWEDSVLLLGGKGGPAADLRLVRPGAVEGRFVDAIGAQVELHHPDRPQKAQLYPANGHSGVSAAELHFALPGSGAVRATVTWRDASGTHRADVLVTPGHRTVELGPGATAVAR